MQEDVEQRSVVLATNATKFSGRCLASLMMASIRKINKIRNTPIEGKQSIKQLSKGGKLESVEISSDNIKAFDPIARKYGISYALYKDTSETPTKWLVFFQSKDTALMTAAFKEFSAQMLNQDKSKHSVRAAIAKFREIIRNTVRDKTRNKNHGAHEL